MMRDTEPAFCGVGCLDAQVGKGLWAGAGGGGGGAAARGWDKALFFLAHTSTLSPRSARASCIATVRYAESASAGHWKDAILATSQGHVYMLALLQCCQPLLRSGS